MLAQYWASVERSWPNIEPALGQCLVWFGYWQSIAGGWISSRVVRSAKLHWLACVCDGVVNVKQVSRSRGQVPLPTRHAGTRLAHGWATVCDVGPSANQPRSWDSGAIHPLVPKVCESQLRFVRHFCLQCAYKWDYQLLDILSPPPKKNKEVNSNFPDNACTHRMTLWKCIQYFLAVCRWSVSEPLYTLLLVPTCLLISYTLHCT